MAEMTIAEIRNRMLHETPVQWCVYLELIDCRLSETPFKTLKEFITGPHLKGGLQIPLERAKELIDFNKAYRHKATKLKIKLGIAEEARNIPPAQSHGGQLPGKGGSIPENRNSLKGGTTARYRIARLKRDHPAIGARLEAGEFKSVIEAERAAGIKDEKRSTYRLVLPLDNEAEARDKIEKFFVVHYSRPL